MTTMTDQSTLPAEDTELEEEQAERLEQFRVKGEQLAERVKALIHEGNVRRVIIKHEGHTIIEIPVTLGVIGVVMAPTLAAVGAIGMLVTDCTLEVIRPDQPTLL